MALVGFAFAEATAPEVVAGNLLPSADRHSDEEKDHYKVALKVQGNVPQNKLINKNKNITDCSFKAYYIVKIERKRTQACRCGKHIPLQTMKMMTLYCTFTQIGSSISKRKTCTFCSSFCSSLCLLKGTPFSFRSSLLQWLRVCR